MVASIAPGSGITPDAPVTPQPPASSVAAGTEATSRGRWASPLQSSTSPDTAEPLTAGTTTTTALGLTATPKTRVLGLPVPGGKARAYSVDSPSRPLPSSTRPQQPPPVPLHPQHVPLSSHQLLLPYNANSAAGSDLATRAGRAGGLQRGPSLRVHIAHRNRQRNAQDHALPASPVRSPVFAAVQENDNSGSPSTGDAQAATPSALAEAPLQLPPAAVAASESSFPVALSAADDAAHLPLTGAAADDSSASADLVSAVVADAFLAAQSTAPALAPLPAPAQLAV